LFAKQNNPHGTTFSIIDFEINLKSRKTFGDCPKAQLIVMCIMSVWKKEKKDKCLTAKN